MAEFPQSGCYLPIRTGARQPKALLGFCQEIGLVVSVRHRRSATRLLIPFTIFLAGLDLSGCRATRLNRNGLGV
jgi:hypothetical protein